VASCGVCGRQVEVSDSGQTMPCSCINTPLGGFLRYAIDTCVNPLPSLEVDPNGVCPRCGANAALKDWCEECDAPPGVACNVYDSPKEPDQDFSEDFDV
jgi:hypothetical protein